MRKVKLVEEIEELQEEDADLRVVLESYVRLYLELPKEHAGTFFSFWTAWWEAVSEHLPPRMENRYNVKLDKYVWVRIRNEMDDHSRYTTTLESDEEEDDDACEYAPDEQAIRFKVRTLLRYGTAEDPADILSDSERIFSW